MSLPLVAAAMWVDGAPSWVPSLWSFVKYGSALGVLALTKRYFGGAKNASERKMHGRVVMITGGLSGIGAETARELAQRGAQVILLTRQSPSDPLLIDFIGEMRTQTGNEMIYAEQVDLASLYSIRQFATKWIDNAPPRRLDMLILCAATLTPPGGERTETSEGIERTWMVNYLANFHLLGILSPAIKAQPFDRDVRVIMTTCSSYISSPPLKEALDKRSWSPGKAYARSKLALMVFGRAFQKHLDAYKRPDELPMNVRVVLVDPGYSRTAGMAHWLTRGSVIGLLLYPLLYFFLWLFLKSANMGAQSIIYAAMEGRLSREVGGKLIKECMEVDAARKDVSDEEVAKELWEASDSLIETVEKKEAQRRAKERKEKEESEKAQEIEALVNTIKTGKEQEARKAKARKNLRFGGKAVL
jgi:NAD(P)-dependent dehydrogenase (short-subunit alcohol dehydrogenase family)